MRILIVSNSLSGGGAETSMRWLNNQLNLHGIDSTLICLNGSAHEMPTRKETVLHRQWKDGLLRTIENLKEFNKVLKKVKPTFVIANCELPELYVAVTPIRLKHLICVEHTSKPWDRRRGTGFFIRLVLMLRRASWVTVNSAQQGIWPLRVDSRYIPNPVSKPTISDSLSGGNRFAFVGRLRREKGLDLILSAVSESGSSIDVFGAGDLRDELEREYSEVSEFHGFVINPWSEIRINQTLIVASEYEGDGIVVVEAILSGIPLLLLDNEDLRRFELPNKNYFKNKEELVEKLRMAQENSSEFAIPAEKVNHYMQERNPSTVLKNWLEILR